MPPRPIHAFAAAVGQCSNEAAAYGKCVVADYSNVYRDKCAQDFARLSACVQAHGRKR